MTSSVVLILFLILCLYFIYREPMISQPGYKMVQDGLNVTSAGKDYTGPMRLINAVETVYTSDDIQ